MAERDTRIAVAFTGVALAACCALPVLVSVGIGVTMAGVSFGNLIPVAMGVVGVGAGLRRWRVRQSRGCPPVHTPDPRPGLGDGHEH